MRQETYTCDVCNGIKGAGNRWLVGWKVKGGFALADWGFTPEGAAEGERVYHFCSDSHALSEQSKHLRQDSRSAAEMARKPVAAEGQVISMGMRSKLG